PNHVPPTPPGASSASVPGRTATTIGTRNPVPTHVGSSTSQGGSRSPTRWVSASASATTTRSSANVTQLATTIVGSASTPGSRTPSVPPVSQSSLIARYGRVPAAASQPTTRTPTGVGPAAGAVAVGVVDAVMPPASPAPPAPRVPRADEITSLSRGSRLPPPFCDDRPVFRRLLAPLADGLTYRRYVHLLL